MNIYQTTVRNYLVDPTVQGCIFQDLHVVNANLKAEINNRICEYLLELRDELQIIIETDYADPVYRDSYYHLYSSKLRAYSKNCIRLSFFEPSFSNVNEFIAKDANSIKKDYLGFLIVRPIKRCIGRNAIAVEAKKTPNNEIEICKAKIKSTCSGHKLEIKAFPHSSQDAEHMSCAENSAWTLLEYFGNKYAVYDPILPSQIIDSLQDSMYERLIPTDGLNYIHLSYVLKQSGFETKIYDSNNPDFFRDKFACYIESGLPLLVGVLGKNFAHAIVCIGRERKDNINFKFEPVKLVNGSTKELSIWNKCVNKFVVNDDNFPIYRTIDFAKPAEGYPIADPNSCYISHFIVPFHGEIHVTAEIAESWSMSVLSFINVDNHRIIRTFLTSSRSYREYIVGNPDISSSIKQSMLKIEMPKFVWLTEILIPKTADAPMRAEGVILLDATGNTRSTCNCFENVIFAMYKGLIYLYDSNNDCLDNATVTGPNNFEMFKGNLK